MAILQSQTQIWNSPGSQCKSWCNKQSPAGGSVDFSSTSVSSVIRLALSVQGMSSLNALPVELVSWIFQTCSLLKTQTKSWMGMAKLKYKPFVFVTISCTEFTLRWILKSWCLVQPHFYEDNTAKQRLYESNNMFEIMTNFTFASHHFCMRGTNMNTKLLVIFRNNSSDLIIVCVFF